VIPGAVGCPCLCDSEQFRSFAVVVTVGASLQIEPGVECRHKKRNTMGC
jgi:hypothetical protein